ncbi:MAG: branched chain amino acid aminotransferase [Candidatus Hecatellales archaeon]|nr:MAG: branched chain amino acid aminotransferase [Candidatus Hecatellales archaeon]
MSIKETKYVWMNGKFLRWEDAKIHVLTHTLHYGSGVFEGIRCYKTVKGPAVFRLENHIKRLYHSAKQCLIGIPYSQEELCNAILKLIKLNNLDECYIRPIAFRGYGEMGLNPLKNPVEVAIAVWPWGAYLGEESLRKGVKARISSYRRFPPNVLPSNVKATGMYLNSIFAKVEALKSGYDEAIMLDVRGYVSEGPGENVFIVKDSVLLTPPEHASILVGITRDSIIKIAKNLEYGVREEDITKEMLYDADEVFFTGTATEVVPICEIDGKKIGDGKPGKITLKIQSEYLKAVRGENHEYEDWLTYVT